MKIRGRSLLSRSHLRNLLVVAMMFVSRPTPSLLVLGWIVFLAGLGIRIWAKGTLRRNEEVTLLGPYALCRHPFYLGNLVLDCGICLMAGRPLLMLLYIPLFRTVYRATIRREEAYLSGHFPEAYEAMSRKPRFMPAPSRDWRQIFRGWDARTAFIKEREATRSLRILAIPLLILSAGDVRGEGWEEIFEWEVLLSLLGAASLNLLGRLIYQVLVRPRKIRGFSRRWTEIGLATCLLAFCVVAQAASQHERDFPSLAYGIGATPLFQISPKGQPDGLEPGRAYLVQDDTLEEYLPHSHRKAHVDRRYLLDFEYFYEVRFSDENGRESRRKGAGSHPAMPGQIFQKS